MHRFRGFAFLEKRPEQMEHKLTYTRIIALGFVGVITIGTVFLCLPAASRSGEWTPFIDALFTATSATCVTGLTLFDTYAKWSMFGQIVILLLVQIGGLGFMTVITMFSIFLRRRIGLQERRLLMQSAGTMRISGVVRLIRRILFGTFVFEGAGAFLLATRFCPDMGFWRGIYNAVFHSVSAFCNAGFDLMGRFAPYSSLGRYAGDVVVNLTVMMLVVVGGIGFLVWSDVARFGFKFSRYELHSKLVLATTAALIFGGAALFFLFEGGGAFAGMGTGKRVMAAFFHSVSTRTAGFSTADMSALSESGRMLTIALMFVGGSPGSTAGGIKTTTLAVLVLGMFAAARHNNGIEVCKKRISDDLVRQAGAIATVYILCILAASLLISAVEPFEAEQVVFEVVSAVGTVGLSTGITPFLGGLSRVVLALLMYAGRVGGLTLMLALAEKRVKVQARRPSEKILIG